jgi:hypothetical protein
MAGFFETTIKNYSGLSTETKPTVSDGYDVPNGSRFREVDTDKTYHYDLSSDTWYETNKHVNPILESMPVIDVRLFELLEEIINKLNITNMHLQAITGEETENDNT